jgi:hypothetical protein
VETIVLLLASAAGAFGSYAVVKFALKALKPRPRADRY